MSEIGHENASNFEHVTSASIYVIREILIGRKTKAVFVITVHTGNTASSYEIMREYKDFFELQCSILDTFPLEGGQTGYERIIPYLPGRKIFRRDDLLLAQERKPDLNKYMNELLKLNPNISRCKLVLDFFAREKVTGDLDKKDLINVARKESENAQAMTNLQCYVNTSYNSDGDELKT